MSKYNTLWKYIESSKEDTIEMTFDDILDIAGIPLDHSFLTYKKELLQYHWQVEKISMKKQTVTFARLE